MKILVLGGSGFVGSNLCRHLLEHGHDVTAMGSRPEVDGPDHERFHYISADTTKEGDWQKVVEDMDAAVNLAGKSIFTIWTDRAKQQIYDSRILTTRNLVAAIPEGKSFVLCSTSAVGLYGDRGDALLTENNEPGDDFLARLAVDWEKEARQAEAKGVRVSLMRFGIVLDRRGGALAKMIPGFKAFAGGPIGSGAQWFPWIHLADVSAAARFLLETPGLEGPFNFTAPYPVRNRELAKTLGHILGRPAFFRVPGFMLKIFLGEFGHVLLSSQRAVPERLTAAGYRFHHPDLETALVNIVLSKSKAPEEKSPLYVCEECGEKNCNCYQQKNDRS